MLRITLAVLHLLALGIGLWAVLARGRALRERLDVAALRRAFDADAHWGLAAALWIGTGLWRYLGETEKTTAYYNGNHLFLAKMGILVLILVLEVWPMVTLVRWRVALGRSEASVAAVDPAAARRIAAISYVQGVLVVLMVIAASSMARGYGARG